MKINTLKNNPSFGKLYIDKGSKNPTKMQEKTIKYILNNPAFSYKLIKDLEKINTDFYITARPCSNEVSLKLYTNMDWFGEKFIPYDGRYNTKMETYINPEFQGYLLSHLKINNFLKRAKEIDLGSDKNMQIKNSILQNNYFCL